MKCQACGAELNDNALFCHACGAKVGSAATATEEVQEHPVAAGLRSLTGRRDEPETELWKGGYSPKAMYGTFVGVALASLALLIGGVMLMAAYPWALYAALGVIALVWLWALGTLVYRQMSIHYRLTTQRFFHETGILTRRTDRIEVIEMDDVAYTQGLIERLLGVGTITISSSDRTHPELVMRGIANVREVSEIIDKARRREITRRGLRIETV